MCILGRPEVLLRASKLRDNNHGFYTVCIQYILVTVLLPTTVVQYYAIYLSIVTVIIFLDVYRFIERLSKLISYVFLFRVDCT